jgi:hypothetical protein
MNIQIADPLQNTLTFSFPTIFEGRAAIVTINKNEAQYKVLINNYHFAHIEFESDFHKWFITDGELSDFDLLKEIGDRIEARYN